MSEAERKRGWWSRLVGENGPTAEDVIQQLEQELQMTRERCDALVAERDAIREGTQKRLEEQTASTMRARAETEQVRRAADAQLGALRGQLESARREHAAERQQLDEKHREVLADARNGKARIASLERELGILQREAGAIRQTSAQAGSELANARSEIARLRAQLTASDQEIADANMRVLDAESRVHDLTRALERTRVAARILRRVESEALVSFGGDVGATLARAIAWRAVRIEEVSLLASTGGSQGARNAEPRSLVEAALADAE